MKDFANFIVEDKDPNEYDNEGEMAKSQLRTVMSAAEDLMNLLDDEDNLPEWAQGKITKAVDYLDSVRDYMASEAQDDLDEQFEELEEAVKLNKVKFKSGDSPNKQLSTAIKKLKELKVVSSKGNRDASILKQVIKRDLTNIEKAEERASKIIERAAKEVNQLFDYINRDNHLLEAKDTQLDEQFEEAFDYFLTDEDIDEAIVESIKIPTDIAKRIPGVKGMLYKKALRYYLDWRKKNPGQGQQGLVKVAKILRVDPKELNILLWNLINKGKLPKHLAVTDPDTPIGRLKFDNKAGFLQK